MGAFDDWEPQFSPWRHGGWYVNNIRYPSGAVGCVAKNAAGRWMITCDRREEIPTFATRGDAARAERELVTQFEYEQVSGIDGPLHFGVMLNHPHFKEPELVAAFDSYSEALKFVEGKS